MPSGLPLVPIWAGGVALGWRLAACSSGAASNRSLVLAAMALVAGLLFDATFFDGVRLP